MLFQKEDLVVSITMTFSKSLSKHSNSYKLRQAARLKAVDNSMMNCYGIEWAIAFLGNIVCMYASVYI